MAVERHSFVAGTRGRERALVLLSRWRVNVATVLVIAVVLLAHPTHASGLAYLVSMSLVLLGLALRVWARGHIERNLYLTQVGPYAFVRHPLYVGSFLVGVGTAAMTASALIIALFVAVFLMMYVPKALREEAFLRRKYGEEYDRYAAVVSAIVPVLRGRRKPSAFATEAQRFSWKRVLRQGEWKTWIGVAVVVAAIWLRARWA